MTLDSFKIKTKICITLDANSGSSVIPLFNYAPWVKAGYRLVNEYFEVQNIKAVAFIYSLPPAAFPVFELEATESMQELAAVNLEWNSPRIQMDVVMNVDDAVNWQRIAAYSLLNPAPYPYREYELGDHSLGENAMLGIQIRNVTFGLLENASLGSDRVTVFADLVRVVTVEEIVDTSSKIANNITTISATIVNSNVNRQGLTFFNSSDKNVFIDTVSTVSITSFMVKLEPEAYYEAPAPMYTGAYYAVVADGSTAIGIREFV